ncbi:F0F1 ATP synthase subunit gamma [soil metagenome]
MSTLNEVKEQMVVVKSVGDFTNALQQIATMRMMKLRSKVLQSRPFVEAATSILKELLSIRNSMDSSTLMKIDKKSKQDDETVKKEAPVFNKRRAVIVVTSNQGLSGQYNIEIYRKLESVMAEEPAADYFVIGKKGQEYFAINRKIKVENFPYEVKDNFTIDDLKRLIGMFDYYGHVTLVYSRFINTATRDVVAISIINPILEESEKDKEQPGKFIFEPELVELIEGVSKKLRAALFQQQIFDARLSQFSAQMVGMKTASDNANNLLTDLRLDYNKARRKMIDKKIGEVFAGSSLW